MVTSSMNWAQLQGIGVGVGGTGVGEGGMEVGAGGACVFVGVGVSVIT